jgi:hypothetical protein
MDDDMFFNQLSMTERRQTEEEIKEGAVEEEFFDARSGREFYSFKSERR